MPIQYVSGDIFVNAYTAQALAHGCNCQGSMGAGFVIFGITPVRDNSVLSIIKLVS